MKTLKFVLFFLVLSCRPLFAASLGPITSLPSMLDLTNRHALQRETVAVLGFSTNALFGKPVFYKHDPTVPIVSHSPPYYIKEISGTNGCWVADVTGAMLFDAAWYGSLAYKLWMGQGGGSTNILFDLTGTFTQDITGASNVVRLYDTAIGFESDWALYRSAASSATMTGKLGVGQTIPDTTLSVNANDTSVNSVQADVYDANTNVSADKGGTIGFGARYQTNSATPGLVSMIAGRRDSATHNDLSGYFDIWTRSNGTWIKAIRAKSSGAVDITNGTLTASAISLNGTTKTTWDDGSGLPEVSGISLSGAVADTRVMGAAQTIGTNDVSIWLRFRVPSTLNGTGSELFALVPSWPSANAPQVLHAFILGDVLQVTLTGTATTNSNYKQYSGFFTQNTEKMADLVITRQGTNLTTYLNGRALSGTEFTTGVAPTWAGQIDSSLFVLGEYASSTYNFNSTFYRAVLYNRALSASQVLALVRTGIDPADQWSSQTPQIVGYTPAVLNGGFENNVLNASGTWRTAVAGASTLSIDTTGTNSHSGANALKFTIDATNNFAFADVNNGSGSTLAANSRYRLSFWGKASAANTNTVLLRADDTGSVIFNTFSALTTTYAKYTVEFTTINGSALSLGRTGNAANTVFWIDDVELVKIGSFLDYDFTLGGGTTIPDRSSNNLLATNIGNVSYSMPSKGLYVAGDATILNNLTVGTNITTSNLTVTGTETVKTISVTSNLTVGGTSTLSGPLVVNSTISGAAFNIFQPATTALTNLSNGNAGNLTNVSTLAKGSPQVSGLILTATDNSRAESSGFPIGTNDFSVWARFRVPVTISATTPGIFQFSSIFMGGGSNSMGAQFNGSTTNLVTKLRDSSGADIRQDTVGIDPKWAGEIIDYVFVRSNATAKVYINGIDTPYSSALAGNWASEIASQYFRIGAFEFSDALGSTMHRAVVYNRALAADEVWNLIDTGVRPMDTWGQTAQIVGYNPATLNGGFEINTLNTPGTWLQINSGTSTATIDTTGTNSHSGSNAAKFTIDSANSFAQLYVNNGANVTTPGGRYRASFWAKLSPLNPTNTATVRFQFGSTVQLNTPTLTTNWTRYFTEFVPTGPATDAKISQYLSSASTTFFVDDVEITKVGAIGDYDFTVGGGTVVPDRSSNRQFATNYGDYAFTMPRNASYVNGNLTVTSNATVSGTAAITGNTTVGGTLGVTGATTVGSVSASDNITVAVNKGISLGGVLQTNWPSTNSFGRTVELPLTTTATNLTADGFVENTYILTLEANMPNKLFTLPTTSVPNNAKFTIVNAGTNTHALGFYPIIQASGSDTNYLLDEATVTYYWNGTKWFKEPSHDFNISPGSVGQLYGWKNRAPFVIPIQTAAPSDSYPYIYRDGDWHRIIAGANTTVSTDGSGNTVVATTGGGGGGPTNGSSVYIDTAFYTAANFIDSAELNPSIAGSNVTYAIVGNSIETNKITSNFRTFFLDRANHSGTQLAATISDFGTNVWTKILSSFTWGNGLVVSTNAGSNIVTVSGGYAPGANVTFTTNADKTISIAAASGGGGSTNGTPAYVNGVQPAAINLTNATEINPTLTGTNVTFALNASGVSAGTYTGLVSTVDTKGRLTSARAITASELLSIPTIGKGLTNNAGMLQLRLFPSNNITFTTNGNDVMISGSAGGGGGNGTNVIVNNTLIQPARFTNSSTVTWTVNGNGDIEAAASGGGGGGGTTVYTTNKQDVPIFISLDQNTFTSTNETSVVGTLAAGGTKQTAANAWPSETAIRVVASGTFTAPGNWQGPTLRVRFGGRVLSASFQDTLSTTPTDGAWTLQAYMQVNSAGSSASNTVVGNIAFQYGTPPGSQGGDLIPMTASGTLDTTVTNYVDVTYQNDPIQPITLKVAHVDAYYLGKSTISGGGGLVLADGVVITNPNLLTSADITNVITSSTNIAPTLRTTGITAGDYTDATITFDTKGRATAAVAVPARAIAATNSFTLLDEFMSSSSSAGDAGTSSAANGGNVGATSGQPGHPGVKFIQITANATNSPNWGWLRSDSIRLTNSSSLELHTYRTMLQTPATISGAATTNVYELQAGFGNLTAAQTNAPGDGAYLSYCTNLITSGTVNWVLTTVNNSTKTQLDTGVAIAASTWYTLEVRLSPTNAIAFINGVSVATNSANIPNGRQFMPLNRLVGYSGVSGNMTVNMDNQFYSWIGYR